MDCASSCARTTLVSNQLRWEVNGQLKGASRGVGCTLGEAVAFIHPVMARLMARLMARSLRIGVSLYSCMCCVLASWFRLCPSRRRPLQLQPQPPHPQPCPSCLWLRVSVTKSHMRDPRAASWLIIASHKGNP